MEQLNLQTIHYQSLTDRLNRLRQQSNPQEITPLHDSQLLKQLAQIKLNSNNNLKIYKKDPQITQLKSLRKNLSNFSLRNQFNNGLNTILPNNKYYESQTLKQTSNLKRVTSQRFYLTSQNQKQCIDSNSPVKGFKERFCQQKDQKKFNFQSPKNKNREKIRLQTSDGRCLYKNSLGRSIKKNNAQYRLHTQNQNLYQLKRSQGRIVRNGCK